MSLVFGAAYAAGGIALSVLMLNLSFDYAGSVISTASLHTTTKKA